MSLSDGWADEYLTLLDDCEARESRLTEWEASFVDSLRSQIEAGRRPSAKQIDALDNILEKATKKG
jgi:ferritin-like metal-binding protein YciE